MPFLKACHAAAQWWATTGFPTSPLGLVGFPATRARTRRTPAQDQKAPYCHRDVGADTISRPGYTATRAVASTAAEALARSRANCRLWLTVHATNNRAIAFYDRPSRSKRQIFYGKEKL